MRKKTVPLISHFCSRKQNAASTDIVYHQALYKGRSVLEPFDLTGYGSVKLPCLVSYNVPSYREHGSHCIYIAATYFEQLSIFEGEWVCVVTGDRDTNHIVSCHVASAQLFPPEVTPEKTAQYSSGEDACSASECCYVSSQFSFLLSNGSCIDNSRPIFVEIIALPLYSGPNTENDVPIQTHLLPNAPAFTSAHMPLPLTHTTPYTFGDEGIEDCRRSFALKIASKCRISRVRSPTSSSTVDYTGYLQRYFSKPRVLSLNEIIKIDATEPSGRLVSVYFQVMELVSDPKLEDWDGLKCSGTNLKFAVTCVVSGHNGKTNLIVEGAINSRIPCIIEKSCALEPFEHNEKLRKQLVKLLRPQMHHLSRQKTPYASVLIIGGRGSGKRNLVNSVGQQLGLHVHEVNCRREILQGANDVGGRKTIKKMTEVFGQAVENSPCILHVRRFRAIAAVQGQTKNEDVLLQFVTAVRTSLEKLHASSLMKNGQPLFFVASCEDSEDVEGPARAIFTHEYEIKPPEDDARLKLLKSYLKNVYIEDGFDVKNLMQRTAGRQCTEIKGIIAEAGKHATNRILNSLDKDNFTDKRNMRLHNLNNGLSREGAKLCKEDFDLAFKSLDVGSSSPGAVASIPNVKWKDVGGLGQAKDEVMDMITLPLKHPELFASGVRQRSGVLFYGPPGTGKTLLAKAVATECNCNFISVKGPELLNMYIGESERNVRQVFERARAAKPCVLFFDEIDSLAPARGKGSDSGGVMDRVVSQLLTEIDGMSSSSSGGDLFVIGATNRPDLLDSSLLRPGRFDRLLYLGIAADDDAQLKILKALTRKFKLKEDVRLEEVIATCPTNYTGADFYALASNALSMAIRRRAKEIKGIIDETNKNCPYYATPTTIPKFLQNLSEEELDVKVGMDDFLEARESIVASVTKEENEKYLKLKEEYSPTIKEKE